MIEAFGIVFIWSLILGTLNSLRVAQPSSEGFNLALVAVAIVYLARRLKPDKGKVKNGK